MGDPEGNFQPCQILWSKDSGSKDMMLLICHMTLQDHVIKGSFDLTIENMGV